MAPLAHSLIGVPVAVFHPLHRRDPSLADNRSAPGRLRPAVRVPQGHRPPGPEKVLRSTRTGHSRQPDESWWCIHPGSVRGLAARFFKRPSAIRVYFDGGAIQAHVLPTEDQDLLLLQPGEEPVQHPRLTPAIHPRVNWYASCQSVWVAHAILQPCSTM